MLPSFRPMLTTLKPTAGASFSWAVLVAGIAAAAAYILAEEHSMSASLVAVALMVGAVYLIGLVWP